MKLQIVIITVCLVLITVSPWKKTSFQTAFDIFDNFAYRGPLKPPSPIGHGSVIFVLIYFFSFNFSFPVIFFSFSFVLVLQYFFVLVLVLPVIFLSVSLILRSRRF